MNFRHPLDPPPLSLARRVTGNALIYGPFVIACGSLLVFFLWHWTVPTLFGLGFIVASIACALTGAVLLVPPESRNAKRQGGSSGKR